MCFTAAPSDVLLGEDAAPPCTRCMLLLAEEVQVQPSSRRELDSPPGGAGQRRRRRQSWRFRRVRVARQCVPRHHLERSVQEMQRRLGTPTPFPSCDYTRNTQGLEAALRGQDARVGPEADCDGLMSATAEGWMVLSWEGSTHGNTEEEALRPVLQQLFVEDVIPPLVVDDLVRLELDAFAQTWVRCSWWHWG